jgi:hypothetical protein
MLKSRLTWFILIVITIFAGLLSRRFAGIPLFVGDILWATMVYFIMRFMFITKTLKWVVVASLIFCFCIEFSQLYKAPWINSLRHTLFGRLVLGETFLWGDLLSYMVGVGIAILVELVVKKTIARRIVG